MIWSILALSTVPSRGTFLSLKYMTNPRKRSTRKLPLRDASMAAPTVAAVSTLVPTSSGATVHFLSPLVSVIRLFWASLHPQIERGLRLLGGQTAELDARDRDARVDLAVVQRGVDQQRQQEEEDDGADCREDEQPLRRPATAFLGRAV